CGCPVSIQIVENVRECGKVCQKTLRQIATVFPDEVERFRELAEYIRSEMEVSRQASLFPASTLAQMVIASRKRSEMDDSPLAVNLRKIREESRIITGIHEIYGSLYDEVGFNRVLRRCRVSGVIMKDMVMARLAKPCSKRSSTQMLERDFGIKTDLEKVYRMMDSLTEKRILLLQDISWQYSRNLLTEEINLLFYDCTTLYFESFTEDDLRRFGYSKDHKFNQGQVLLALMVTGEGMPVGYEVFPGNLYEGDTFRFAIEKIKKRYRVKRAIVVSDSGLLSKPNIKLLEKEHYEFILGARLRNLSNKWQNKILDNRDYIRIKKENEIVRLTDYTYSKERRLIVSHSSARAEKNCRDRISSIEKLRQKLEKSKRPESLISNYGYKKYLTVEGNVQVRVNEEKLEKDALWDGLHGVFTNIKPEDMSAEEVLSHYHGLWQVEESFRITKHDLRIRPVFHWSAKRIRAHIAICFVAFALIRFLQHRLLWHGKEMFSAEKIREELFRVQESIIRNTTNNEQYVIPSKPSQDVERIYEIMHRKRNVVPFKLTSKV
ncbi:MAG: IS1634 family transposase, partial [Bacteroidales bacterium]|nr:IS1634 family transposase [Bacteroidales bacterium]